MFTCDKYDIDTEAIFLALAPYFWITTPETDVEKEVWVKYMSLVSTAFANFQDELLAECYAKYDLLLPTGQHLSLENYLNSRYDDTLRRIFITENNVSQVNYIWYLTGEAEIDNKVWYKTGETDPADKNWFLTSDLYNNPEFTVNIPTALASAIDETELRAWMSNYVVNGFTFNIIYF